MGTSWEVLLSQLINTRNFPYRCDDDRYEAQIEAFDYILQTILEKLRDAEVAQRCPQETSS